MTGNTNTALQKAEHTAGARPFSLPAQPLHLPDMGMSPEIGILLCMLVADLTMMSGPLKPCATKPTAKTNVASKAGMRRIFPDHMAAE